MVSAETVELPRDRKGRTLHVYDKVLILRDGEPYGQGRILSMTLTCLSPVHWRVELYAGALDLGIYATRLDGFEPSGLERIEEAAMAATSEERRKVAENVEAEEQESPDDFDASFEITREEVINSIRESSLAILGIGCGARVVNDA